jgi:hypothetical protein
VAAFDNPFPPIGVVRDAPDRKGQRAKEAGPYQWKDIDTVYEIKEGQHKGWSVAYIKDAADLAYLGYVMGHCAGTHWVWACEEKTWYFFALLDPKGLPKDTVHCKWEKWVGKTHPRDPLGRGYDQAGGMELPPDVETALKEIRYNRNAGLYGSGGYTTFPQVEAAFKACNKEYEPGKYKATFLNSTYGGGYKDRLDDNSWDRNYGPYQLHRQPPGIDPDVWDQYTKLMQKMKAEYDKKNANVQVGGRVFTFDTKKIVVVSYNQTYRTVYGDWLIHMGKKKVVTSG